MGDYLIFIFVTLFFFASVRVAIFPNSDYRKPEKEKGDFAYYLFNSIIYYLTHGWILALGAVTLIPMQAGPSPLTPLLPWEVFEQSQSTEEGVFGVLLTIATILWFFWIPAHIYAAANPSASFRFKLSVRINNFLLGLLFALGCLHLGMFIPY